MEFIKYFNQSHYQYYHEIIGDFIDDDDSINQWVKNTLNDDELIIWINLIKLGEMNNYEYYEELSILLTILINFFIIELDVNVNEIKLKNSEIKKLFFRFKHIIYIEYSNRNKLINNKDVEYILLK